MLVVKATGLVPVKSTVRGGRSGIFGVTPATARQGLKDKTLALVDIPNDIDTYTVQGLPEEASPKAAPVSVAADINIPDDWRDAEPLVRFNLAKRIAGKPPVVTDEDKKAGLKSSDVANRIIEAEVQRRAAAAEEPAE